MRKSAPGVVVVLLSLAAACGTARAHDPDPAPDPLPVSYADTIRPASATITRSFDNELEYRLIRIAESLLPDAAAVRSAAQRHHSSLPPGDSVWWVGSVHGIRIPFAITDEALAYYWGLYYRLETKQPQLAREPLRWARLRYLATVEPLERAEIDGRVFRDAYVVRLNLRFEAACGPRCGGAFSQTRRATLTRDGGVLALEGDGWPDDVAAF